SATTSCATTLLASTRSTPRLLPTQAERVAASDRALLEAAVDLIAERGYERTTLALIGERAGYSRGLVTQRFGNKERLLWAVIRQILEQWSTHSLSLRVDKVGVPALQAILSAYLDACDRSPKHIKAYYALLREADGPVAAVRDTIRKLHATERSHIAALIRAGKVRADVDADAEATAFLGVMRGVTMQWLLDPKAVDLVGTLTQYGVSLERTLGAN
ncbi:MAG TPA: TetR/AcrR family transcriptional regulator, partial [Acidimicrobiales bacterium]|nr:TetR/AcrR family transcriptional regulator [Acidimicrobiales bacterium]